MISSVSSLLDVFVFVYVPSILRLRTYDSLNRLKTYKDVNNKLIGYDYDKVGNLKRITYPDYKTVSYQYTDANQLYKVTDWASRITEYTYDDNGRLETVIRPNGTVLILTYDDKGQLETMIDQDTSLNVINAYVLTYDKEGNVTVEDRTGGETYTIDNNFDDIYRLTQQKETINSVTNEQYDYSYDAGGNIKTIQTTTGTMQVQVYGDANHLSTVDGQIIVHDADGNMNSGILNGSQTNFTFDARNRLTSAGTSTYTYNAENQRTSITENGKTTNYVIDPNAALSRVLTKTENGVTTYYVYGLGLIGEETNSTYSTYHYDLRGSTIALTNTSGTVTDTFNYGPYGELETRTGLTDVDYLYSGRDGVITDDNGLYYMRARYYNPEIKRFLSEDQFAGKYGNILDVNLYGYVGGNPIGFVDPSGYVTAPSERAGWESEFDNEIARRYHIISDGYSKMIYHRQPYYYDNNGEIQPALHSKQDADVYGEMIAISMVANLVSANVKNINILNSMKTNGMISIDSVTIVNSATAARKGGETVAGHALQKHAGRNPDIWGKIKGGADQINQAALDHINQILDGAGDFIEVTTNRGVTFLEKVLSDGRGLRLNIDGTFKGFIDK